MMYPFKKARAFLLLAFFPLVGQVPGFSQTVSLTILHTNDTHGHLLPFSYPSLCDPGSDLARMPVHANIGGIARRAALARRIRDELNRKGETVWLVDAGDFSDGTPFSIRYFGEADIAAMNASGYDFAALGNHEFNYPLAQTRKLIALARYPILCANATLKTTGEPLTTRSKIERVGTLSVGLFGLVTMEAASYPAGREGVTISDEIETARQTVADLRAKADIIVLISHSGEETDKKLAETVPGIDVIVGGHSHSRLPSGEFVWRSGDLQADAVNGTIVLQAHKWGGELGRCDLLFKKDPAGAWHVDRYRERLIPVTDDIRPDSAVAAVVDQYWKPITAYYDEVIGQAAGDFTSRGDDWAEYNLAADAVRETFGTDVELENMGGIRSPLIKGSITRGDLVNLDPFNNTIDTFRISGLRLKGILKEHTPAVSGMRYRIENGELTEITVNGKPIEDNKEYSGAINSYFAGIALKGMKFADTRKPRLDVIVDYIRRMAVIRPLYDGRRVIIDE
jgi:2',3'-cyclic-nucleotide 2'-phosphodiesterase (5'-nucleotidase family)